MANTNRKIFESEPLSFGVDIEKQDDRLDCFWFNPVFENKIEKLRLGKNKKRKLVKLKVIADVNGGKRLPKGTVIQDNEMSIIPYVRVTDVKNLKINSDLAAKITKEVHREIQEYQWLILIYELKCHKRQ